MCPGRALLAATLPFALLAITLAGCRGDSGQSPNPGAGVSEALVVPQAKPIEPRRVSFAPNDEHRLLVLEASGLLGIWDVRDVARPLRVAWIPAGAVDAAFSADGTEVVSAGFDGKVRWWSLGGRLLRTSQGGHAGIARALAIGESGSPGSSGRVDDVVSGGEDGTLRVWGRDGTPRGAPIAAHDGFVVSVAMRANGDLVSAGTDETIRLWEKDPGSPSGYRGRVLHESAKPNPQLAHVLKHDLHMGWDHAVAFAPGSGALVATNFDGGIRLWAAGNWDAPTTVRPRGRQVRAVAWAPGGELFAAGGFDGKVATWRADGSAARVLAEQTSVISSVALSSTGGRLATVSVDDNRVRLSKMDGTPIGELSVEQPQVTITAKLLPEGPQLAAADRSGRVRRWRLGAALVSEDFAGDGRGVLALAFSPSDDLLALGVDAPKVRLWSGDGSKSEIRSAVDSYVDEVAFSPDGKVVLAAATAGRIQLLNLDGTARTGVLRICQEMIFGTVLSPAADRVTVLCDWGTVTGTAFDRFEPRPVLEAGRGARGLALDDGKLISGGLDGVLRLWSPDGKPLETAHVGLPIQRIGLHPWGTWVSANANAVLFFDRARKLRATAIALPDAMLVFTPDGWFAGSEGVERFVRLVSNEGRLLDESAVAARRAPDEVRARLTKG